MPKAKPPFDEINIATTIYFILYNLNLRQQPASHSVQLALQHRLTRLHPCRDVVSYAELCDYKKNHSSTLSSLFYVLLHLCLLFCIVFWRKLGPSNNSKNYTNISGGHTPPTPRAVPTPKVILYLLQLFYLFNLFIFHSSLLLHLWAFALISTWNWYYPICPSGSCDERSWWLGNYAMTSGLGSVNTLARSIYHDCFSQWVTCSHGVFWARPSHISRIKCGSEIPGSARSCICLSIALLSPLLGQVSVFCLLTTPSLIFSKSIPQEVFPTLQTTHIMRRHSKEPILRYPWPDASY